MPQVTVKWQTRVEYAKTFDAADLDEYRDEDGDIDNWAFDSHLADLECDDPDAYDGTVEREITSIETDDN